MTRHDFLEVTRPLLDRCVAPLEQVFADAAATVHIPLLQGESETAAGNE